MIESTMFHNILFYIIFGVFIIFFIFYFITEIRIKRKRQKEWNAIKDFFKCKDTESIRRLYKSYIYTIKKHWLLGYIYPDM